MADPSSVVAIDQGTTSTRAMILRTDGGTTICHAVNHQQLYPQSGWVEHDPEEIIRSIRTCLAAAGPVDAVAIDNQGESCLAWDAETKQALSPIIVWQDNRTAETIERLRADGLEPDIQARSGLPLDSYFSASKLAWLFQTVPDAKALLDQGRLRLGTTDAFFLDRLTGHCVTDIATASRTSLMNIATGEWDSDLCRIFGVPIQALPEIVSTSGDFGAVDIDGRLVPIVASIVDQQAALYGHGCRGAGNAKVTFGTGAFALMVTGTEPLRAPERGILPTVAWRNADQATLYAIDGAVYTASAAINWARSLGLFTSFDDINSFDKDPAIGRGVAFVPALAGLACPHWDRGARGSWLGLSLETDAHDMMQAILEGIAFRTAEVIDAMHDLSPIAGPLSVDGGLSQNPYFTQFLSDILQRDLVLPSGGELTALGTAQMAAEAIGMTFAQDRTAQSITPRATPDHWRPDFARAVALCQAWRDAE